LAVTLEVMIRAICLGRETCGQWPQAPRSGGLRAAVSTRRSSMPTELCDHFGARSRWRGWRARLVLALSKRESVRTAALSWPNLRPTACSR